TRALRALAKRRHRRVRDVDFDAVERQRSVRREDRAADRRFRFALTRALRDVALEAFALVDTFATTVGRADIAVAALIAGWRAERVAECAGSAVIPRRT